MISGYRKVAMGLFTTGMTVPAIAAITFGNAESSTGALTASATLRANYQDQHYGEPSDDQKLHFDVAIFSLDYDSPDWFAATQYNCYQYDTLCDFSTLVYGYVGYHLNESDHFTLGVQPIPFGPGRFWDSSFYAGINNTMGLQDVNNLGLNYHLELATQTQIDLAYFAKDGGSYVGSSTDAARYSANMLTSIDPLHTDLNEKNMWMARINQPLNFLTHEDLKVSVGGSYWWSEIDNNKNSAQGTRQAWALFNSINYKNLAVSLTAGQLNINNKDALSPYASTFGSFESEYLLANQGYFYTFDTHYTFNNVKGALNITPYMVYSGFDKTQKGFADSMRHIVGAAFDYKKFSVYAEYVMSKNDPFIGGTADSLALGDDGRWNTLLNLTFIYNF